MKALRAGNQVGLVFTTVVDQMTLGLAEEDDEGEEPTDRSYWESSGSKATVAIVDKLLEVAKVHDPDLELKFNKFYIELSKNGQARNFVIFRPKELHTL